MTTYRATSPEGTVTEYVAASPDPAHLAAGWRLEEVSEAAQPASPPPPEPYAGSWHITNYAFRKRFSDVEKGCINVLATPNPATPLTDQIAAGTVKAFLDDALSSNGVILTLPEVRAGLVRVMPAVAQMATAVGVTIDSAARVTEILETTPSAEDLWHGE